MKARGILSARRSQQYSGHSSYGDADIIADELPGFHIECKGTKGQKISRAILKEWWNQIHHDAREGKLAVIFHIANGCEPVVLVPYHVLESMHLSPACYRHVTGGSVTPSEHVGTQMIIDNLFNHPKSTLFLTAFCISPSDMLCIINGSDFLELMKKHEPTLRLDSTTSRPKRFPLHGL